MWAASPPGPDRAHRLGPESSRPRDSGISGLRDAEILGRAPTRERCRTAYYILHAEDYLKYFGEGWRGGLPTPARLYAGELEELYRHSLKGLFSKIERLSDSTEGALSAVGEGGSSGSASTRPPWRLCWLPRDARLLAGPALREVLGQRQNVDALRAGEGVWLGVRPRRGGAPPEGSPPRRRMSRIAGLAGVGALGDPDVGLS